MASKRHLTAEFHPADGKKPKAYADMEPEQKALIRKTIDDNTKHGPDDPFPDGPVVMEGVELLRIAPENPQELIS